MKNDQTKLHSVRIQTPNSMSNDKAINNHKINPLLSQESCSNSSPTSPSVKDIYDEKKDQKVFIMIAFRYFLVKKSKISSI